MESYLFELIEKILLFLMPICCNQSEGVCDKAQLPKKLTELVLRGAAHRHTSVT